MMVGKHPGSLSKKTLFLQNRFLIHFLERCGVSTPQLFWHSPVPGSPLPIWGFPKIGVPQNGWFIMENPIKMDDLGYHYFGNTHILMFFTVPPRCSIERRIFDVSSQNIVTSMWSWSYLLNNSWDIKVVRATGWPFFFGMWTKKNPVRYKVIQSGGGGKERSDLWSDGVSESSLKRWYR